LLPGAPVFRHILAIACLFGSLGAGTGETVYDPGACDGRCEHPIAYTLDPQFNADERRVIDEAMRVWERGSGARVCFAPGGDDLVIEKLDRSEQLRAFDPDWPQHVALTRGGRIWIVAARIDDEGEYRGLIVHELGHYLGIGHIEDTAQTYMHSTINDTPVDLWKHARLPPRDGRAFCEVRRCTCAL
jgi:hypothetical protein